MADLSRQARCPMTIVSAVTAYCYDRVYRVIMSLVWLVLTNGNIPAIIATLVCLQTMKFFQCRWVGESKMFFGGKSYSSYIMGLGQGNTVAPISWIQLSAILVILDAITMEMIHSMRALFVDGCTPGESTPWILENYGAKLKLS
jgi:hypothetical protein